MHTRTLLAALLVFLCGCSHLSLPLAVIPPSPTANDFPDAGAAVLEDDATLEFRVMEVEGLSEPKLVAVLDHRRRIKVLSENGLQAARVDLMIDGYTTVIDVVARSVSPTGHTSNMPNRAIEYFAPWDPKLRSKDVKIIRLHIPDAKVGGLIEYRYQRVFTDPDLLPPWVFGDNMPILHSAFGLVTSPELGIDFRYAHGAKRLEKTPLARALPDGRERLLFVETDLPAYYPEPSMPPLSHRSPWIQVALRTARLDGNKPRRTEGWDDVAATVIDRMQETTGGAGRGSVMERYDAMRKSIRPLLLYGLGVRRPQSERALLNGAPACRRDAEALLLRSFVGADITAYPAFLTSEVGPPLALDFPGEYAFTHATVAVELTEQMLAKRKCTGEIYARDALCGRSAGQLVFLDPACKHCAFGVLPTEAANGQALLATGDGVKWIKTPPEQPERHSTVTRITYKLDVDGSLEGDLLGEARGTVAQRLRDALVTADEDEEQVAILGTAFLGEAPGPGISSYTLGHVDSVEAPLSARMHLQNKLQKEDIEHFGVSAKDLVGSSLHEYWRGSRHNDCILMGPQWQELTLEMAMPVGYVVEVPPPIKVSNRFAEYAGGFAVRGQSLMYARRFVLKVPTVKAEDWDEFIELVEQIRDAEAMVHRVRLGEG